MKPKFLLPLLALLSSAAAQSSPDGVLKVTVTMLADGRHKSTLTDPDKHTTEETIEDSKGKVYSRTVYALDDRNLAASASYFDGKGTLLSKATFKRDASDRIAEETFTSANGQPLGRRVYTFGANNKVAQMDTYDPAGQLLAPPRPASPGRPDKKKRR